MPQAKEAASGEAGRVRKEFSVSEEWKGQCDQDVISEQASKWTMGRDVAGVGGRARSWDLTGSRDTGTPTIARLWVRTTPQPAPLQAAFPCLSLPFLDSLTSEWRLNPHLQGSEGKSNLTPTEHVPESRRGPGPTG